MDQIAKSMEGLTIGVAITGSFCTFSRVIEEVKALKTLGAELIPIFSLQVQSTDSRFGKADTFIKDMEAITEKQGIYSITEAEPIGPKALLDVLVIMPCTGNTLAKLAVGISDTPVLMAAKAHLRNEKPLVLSISTNDALGANLNNIGSLMNKKHVFFVPFGQDDYKNKPNSMVAHMELIPNTIQEALHGKQIQPVIVA
ncbi:MAG: dipicolinate synthase subunit B [Lachnospiraceae bacterium]|nr:dipicolinate synthase subunit B [Lachnospiraceae bacterium]